MNIEDIENIHRSIWLHFTQDGFDYFKYNGKARKQNNKEPNRLYDKIGTKLKKKHKVVWFFVSNFVNRYEKDRSIPHPIIHYVNRESFDIYKDWRTRMKSLQYHLQRHEFDLEEYMFLDDKAMYPKCMDSYLRKQEIIEFFPYMISKNPEIEDYWLSRSSDKYFFPNFLKFCKKYARFVVSDKFYTPTLTINS